MPITIDGTNGITLPTSGAPIDNVIDINGGQLAGMRNKIINGKMDIAQRGTSFAAIANNSYSLDRFLIAYTSTAVTTITQDTASVPSSNEFQNALKVAVTTADAAIAAGDFYEIIHRIEGYNARDLIGKTFTLSFWVYSSKTGTHCVAFRNSGSDRSYIMEYTVNAANTWEYKTLTVTNGLITAGTWNWTNGIGLGLFFMLACGSTYQTTANAWQTGNFLATANQVNCLDSISNVFALTGVQLEVGAVATPFEHRTHGQELALCQRYYIDSNPGSATAVNSSTGYSAGAGGITASGFSFPVTMRTGPVVTYKNQGFSNCTAITSSNIGPSSVWAGLTASAAGACACGFNYTANAEL